jgi:hypothetical protein
LIAQVAAVSPRWNVPGEPPASDELAVELIRRRTAAPAALLAVKLRSPAAIDAVVSVEKRRAVWLALAANPQLTEKGLVGVLHYGNSQRPLVQEKLAEALLGSRGRLGAWLNLLSEVDWLAGTKVGRYQVVELARAMGGADADQLARFVALTPSAAAARMALTKVLVGSRWRGRRKHLSGAVVGPLFAKAHPYRCDSLCGEVGAWAVRYGPGALSEVYNQVNCPRGLSTLLGEYQRSDDKANWSAVVTFLGSGDPARIEGVARSSWLSNLARAKVVVDGPLAKVLVRESGRRRGYYDSYREVPRMSEDALGVFCTSSDWGLACYALGQMADPALRCTMVGAWFEREEAACGSSVSVDGLAGLAQSKGMIEAICALDDSEFCRWASEVWSEWQKKLPSAFAERALKVLPIEELMALREKLRAGELVTLAERALAVPTPECTRLVTELLSEHGELFGDAELRWAMLCRVPVNQIPALLGVGGEAGVVKPGEIVELLARRPDCAEVLTRQLSTARQLSWADAALEVLPLTWDSMGTCAWGVLNARLTEAFGDDKASWTIAMGLLETWSSTIPELVATTRTLGGS